MNGVNDARELDECAVTGVLDDLAVVLADLRADHLALQHAQPPVGLLLIQLHQA